MKVDGGAFADAWRAGYAPSMNRVRTGQLPWTPLDGLHRMTLDGMLGQFGLTGLSEQEIAHLNRAWHRLAPWPDSVPGLTRLKRQRIIAPLSNGNIALMTDMAKHAGLPWDCILGAELVRHYKPDREVYQSAADFLMLKPAEVMMVAAHLGDLKAASRWACGPRSCLGRSSTARRANPTRRRMPRWSHGEGLRRARGEARLARLGSRLWAWARRKGRLVRAAPGELRDWRL